MGQRRQSPRGACAAALGPRRRVDRARGGQAPLRWAFGAWMAVWVLAGCGAEALQGQAPLDDAGLSDAAAGPTDAALAIDAGVSIHADAGASPDGGAPADQCDPVTQQGCVAPAIKCVVEGPAPGAACVEPGADEQALGDPCAGRDCEAGLACALVSTTSTISECVKVCDLTSGAGCEALGLDYECRTRLTGTNWGACQELPPTCDPYSQAPCAAAEACQPFLRRTGTWEFRCRAAGLGEEDAACGGSNPACQRGLACVSTPRGAAFCRRICQLNTDCANQRQCNGVVSEPPFMYCGD
jgi:hypothetical protein